MFWGSTLSLAEPLQGSYEKLILNLECTCLVLHKSQCVNLTFKGEDTEPQLVEIAIHFQPLPPLL